MAKISYAVGGNQEHSAFVSLTSLGVMLCMILSAVCIKFWGFKHRLRFNQQQSNKQTDNNGVASGSQPLARYKQQSSVPETVVVHGIFRKRGEDELDIVRPTELPPVRIRNISQSTSNLNLLPPPRSKRRNEIQTTAFEELQTPHHQPPPMPPRKSDSQPNTLQPEERPLLVGMSYEEFEQRFRIASQDDITAIDIDGSIAKVVEIIEPRQEVPFSPTTFRREQIDAAEQRNRYLEQITAEENNRYLENNQILLLPAPTPRTRKEQQITELPATTSLAVIEQPKQDVEHVQTLIENDAKQVPSQAGTMTKAEVTGYMRYEEVDAGDLVDIRESWKYGKVEEFKRSSYSEADSLSLERYLEAKLYPASEPEYVTQEFFNSNDLQPPTPNYSTMPTNLKHSEKTLMMDYDPRFDAPPHHFRALLEGDSDSWRSDRNSKSSTSPQYVNVQNASSNNFNEEIEETYRTAAHEISFRFPSEEPIMPEEKSLPKASEHEHFKWSHVVEVDHDHERVWREMESDIKDDLMSNIEAEFNKLKSSFKEDEGDFLGFGECHDPQFEQRIPSEETVIEEVKYENVYVTEPDEQEDHQYQQDPNFAMNYETRNIYANLPHDVRHFMYDRHDYATNGNTVTTNFSITELPSDDGRPFEEIEVHGKELTFYQTETDASGGGGGGGYVRNVEELYKEIESGDEELEVQQFPVCDYADAHANDKKVTYSILKSSKRTTVFDATNNVEYFVDADDTGEPAKLSTTTEKSKDSRKVSFDLNTEDHYLSDTQEIDSEEEYEEQDLDDSYYPRYAHNYYYQEYNERVKIEELNEPPTPSKRVTNIQYLEPEEILEIEEECSVERHELPSNYMPVYDISGESNDMQPMNHNWFDMHEQHQFALHEEALYPTANQTTINAAANQRSVNLTAKQETVNLAPIQKTLNPAAHAGTVNASATLNKPQPAARKISNASNTSSNAENNQAIPKPRPQTTFLQFQEGSTKA